MQPIEAPSVLQLQAYLIGEKPFEVPQLQRPYAWEKDEVDDFLEDVDRVVRAVAHAGATEPAGQFFGGIVSVQYADPGFLPNRRSEVIDGQQRLATVSLFLASIRDGLDLIGKRLAADEDPDVVQRAEEYLAIANTIESEYLTYERTDLHHGSKSRHPVLRLSDVDRDHHLDIVDRAKPLRGVKKGAPASHKRLTDAARAIRSRFGIPEIGDADVVRLRAMAESMIDAWKAAMHHFHVIHIYTKSDRRQAYRLFMTLNDRGKSLSDAELLRTHSLELLQGPEHRTLQAEAARDWDEILSRKASDTNAFLAAYYASRTGVRGPRKEIYDRYVEQFLSEVDENSVDARAARIVRDLAASMRQEQDVFETLGDGAWPFEGPGGGWWEGRLHRLVSVLGRKGDLPFLLSAVAVKDEAFVRDAVDRMERIGFRCQIVGVHAGSLAETYFEQAGILRAAPDAYDLARFDAELGAFVREQAPDDSFRAALAAQLQSGTPKAALLVRHALSTLEDHWSALRDDESAQWPDLRPRTGVVAALESFALDHIRPTSTGRRGGDAESGAMQHRLGNLALVTPDTIPDGSDFEAKRSLYAASDFATTQQVARAKRWGDDEIREREARLIEDLVRTYALPGSGRSRRRASTAATWLIHQRDEAGNPYGDEPGRSYHYRRNLPNGTRIGVGDVAVILRMGARPDRTREISGVGRIVRIDEDGLERRAHFEPFIEVSPGVPFEELGGDPRANVQHSMNPVSAVRLAEHPRLAKAFERLSAGTRPSAGSAVDVDDEVDPDNELF